jgi:hypothetical protein
MLLYTLYLFTYRTLVYQMLLFENQWSIFVQLKTRFEEMVDSQSGKPRMNLDEVKKIDKKLQIKEFQEIFDYLKAIQQILDLTNPADYYCFPQAIFRELENIRLDISGLLTQIRTIRIVYKHNALFQPVFDVLNKLSTNIHQLINHLFQMWLQKSRDDKCTIPFSIEAPMKYESFPQIWWDINRIRNTHVTIELNVPFWLKSVQIWSDIESFFRDPQKNGAISPQILESLLIYPSFSGAPGMALEQLRLEFLYFLFQNHWLLDHASSKPASKADEKAQRSQLEDFRDHLLMTFLKEKSKSIEIDLQNEKFSLKQISGQFGLYISGLEEKVLEEADGDIKIAQNLFSNKIKDVKKLLTHTVGWLQRLEILFNPFENLIQTVLRSFEKIDQEYSNRLEDFATYAQTLQEESHRSDLNAVIDEKIEQLNQVMADYEKRVNPLLEVNLPTLDQILGLFQDYNKQFIAIKADMNQVFKTYREKQINLHSSLKLWEDKFEEIRNRSRFLISTALSDYLKKLRPLIDAEQDFIKGLGELAISDDLPPIQFDADMLLPDRLTEKEVRDRLNHLDKKLNELDRVRQVYELQRQKYSDMLAEYLKTHDHLKNQQCVICRKVVDIVEDHFIKCNFCGSMMHYVCGAMWIDKYNACPVCHNNYTIPRNGVYNPDELEEDH